MHRTAKVAAVWLAVIPWLLVRGFPVDEFETTSLFSRSPADAQPQETIDVAQPGPASSPYRSLGRTAFGTDTRTWPGISEQPGDYQKFTTWYETTSANAGFRSTSLFADILDGPGNCDTQLIIGWYKITTGLSSNPITWKDAKDDVMNADPAAALASIRTEAQVTLAVMRGKYASQYRSQQPIEQEWGRQLAGGWRIRATTNEQGNDGIAFAVDSPGPSPQLDRPLISMRSFGVAALVISCALIEILFRKITESTATFTTLDAFCVRVALWVARSIGLSALKVLSRFNHHDPPTHVEIEHAIADIGGNSEPGPMQLYYRWFNDEDYKTLLGRKQQAPCRAGQAAVGHTTS